MCGRYILTHSAAEIAHQFGLTTIPELTPRYNIAPSQPVAIVTGERQLQFARWGLIPPWAKDKAISSKLINARAETLSEKPSFREAFKHRRCLILADGFYEWQGVGKKKQPYCIRLEDERLFAFAGLWESWRGEGELIDSCTIITTNANDSIRPIHDRMPVILPPAAYETWLAPTSSRPDLQSLLVPIESDRLKSFPVSTLVNSPAHDRPELLSPLTSLRSFIDGDSK
ncbi:MAG: SOS response-associated protein YedK (plasmid) [Chroococcopsis gigantea SAG 12.99]|jgi:putative SOS response-associated peptidase YedK|nr:SOS response-associated protein YedK [Chroococcopsis gigantea SAG 12.99]